MIRVLIADDHDVVRTGLRLLVEHWGEAEVAGEAADGQETLDLVTALMPDVLLLDISMPRLDGIEVLQQLGKRGLPTRAVVVSRHTDEAVVQATLEAGARGYVVKVAVRTDLLPAVRAAYRGEIFLSPSIADIVVKRLLEQNQYLPTAPEAPLSRLTEREQEVLRLLALGHTNKTMAQTMRISPRTVEKHRANLMDKLNAPDLATLVQIALQTGLIGVRP